MRFIYPMQTLVYPSSFTSVLIIYKIVNFYFRIKSTKKCMSLEKSRLHCKTTHKKNAASNGSLKKYQKNTAKEIYQNIHEHTHCKSLFCQITRLSGQEKLLYVKTCIQKQVASDQLFKFYPACSLKAFTLYIDVLRKRPQENSENPQKQIELLGTIVEDQNGKHFVQIVQNINSSGERDINKCEGEYNKNGDLFNGLAISIFKDGRVFEGNYHDGHFCGMGYQLSPNGNIYIGHFKDGTKNGEGTYYWFNNNQMYKGKWQGGLPHGEGMYISQDVYQGTFSNGLKYGCGVQSFSNGDKYIGQYINGVADGYGEYYWNDGSVYKGDFKHGVRHGYGTWEDQKQSYKGSYRMDKKQGLGIYTWAGRQSYKGEFKQDYRDGYGQIYEIKGNKQKILYKGCWQKGLKNQRLSPDKETVSRFLYFIEQEYRQHEELQRLRRQQEERNHQHKHKVGHQNCIPNQYHK